MQGKTKGATSFVSVKVGDLIKVLMQSQSVPVSRIWAQKNGFQGLTTGKASDIITSSKVNG